MTGALRRAVAFVAIAVALIVALASPAAAHNAAGSGATGSNYRVTVTSQPSFDGVSLTVGEAGQLVVLHNDSDSEVTVLDYSGLPYLRVGPDGVFENSNSPATYLNRSADSPGVVPDGVGEGLPQWRLLSDSSTASWHDHRAHWMVDEPAAVQQDPGRRHHVSDWEIPLVSEGVTSTARGSIEWVPAPAMWVWAAVSALVAGVAAGLLVRFSPTAQWVLAAVAAALYAVHLWGVWVDSVEPSAEKLAIVTFPALSVALLVGSARVYNDSKLHSALLGLGSAALTGVVIAAGTWSWLTTSQVPSGLPPDAARLLVAVLVGLSGGTTAWAAVVLMGPPVARWRGSTALDGRRAAADPSDRPDGAGGR